MMQKNAMDHLEFYITNVCNLTCENCRSFNNHRFSGIYKFDQNAISQWSKKLDLAHFSILGGEPNLHPHLEQWMLGLRKAWPNAVAELITNGTHLSKVKGLHNMLAEYNYELQISVHGKNLRELIAKEIFLAFGELKIQKIENNKIWFRTDKGVLIDLQNNEHLQEILFIDNDFNLHHSDPAKAHANCMHKSCHHMIDNKIYKCSVVGLLPEFLKQQGKSTDHLISYHGIDVHSVSKQTIASLSDPIPHCAICPESPKSIHLDAILKKHVNFKKDTPS